MRSIQRTFLGAALALCAATATAVPMTYTNPADFLAALPGAASTLDFESSTAGDLIADGGSLGGIQFNYPVLAGLDYTLQVQDLYTAQSGENYLGTVDDLSGDPVGFLNLDDLDIAFAASHAIGLYILTGEILFDGDVSLIAGGATVTLDTANVKTTNGDNFYFLGIVDTATTFTTASLTAYRGTVDNCDTGCFFYDIDDIITSHVDAPEVPVPAPPVLALLLLGLAVARFRSTATRASPSRNPRALG